MLRSLQCNGKERNKKKLLKFAPTLAEIEWIVEGDGKFCEGEIEEQFFVCGRCMSLCEWEGKVRGRGKMVVG